MLAPEKSLQLIFKSQKARLNVTSEITPHHLFLDSSYLSKFGTLAKTNPLYVIKTINWTLTICQ